MAYKKLYRLELLDNIKHFKFAIGAFANTKGILANTVASLGLMVIKISEYQAVAAPQLLKSCVTKSYWMRYIRFF